MGASRAASLYFVNGWLDLAVIGGLSIAVFAVARIFFSGPASREIGQAAAVLSVFVNYPHFSATLYRLYENPDNVRRFPLTAIALPVLLTGAIAASLWWPDLVAPYFILLFLLWSPYHYSGQTVGITMIYARRAGIPIGPRERTALSIFVFSTFVARLTSRGPGPRICAAAPRRSSLIFACRDHADAGRQAVFCDIVRWCRKPAAAARCAVAAARLYSVHAGAGSGHSEFVPLFHSLQYLYIAWAILGPGWREREAAIALAVDPAKRPDERWSISAAWCCSSACPGCLSGSRYRSHSDQHRVAAVNIQHFFMDG